MINQNLCEKLEAFDQKVIETIVCDSEQIAPILDGIIDLERYFSANYKILWILKEPYDDFNESGDPKGGEWDLRELIRSKNSHQDFKDGGKQTYMPMIYTSWGILNDFTAYDNITDLDKDASVVNALKSVAYINVSKLPGRTSTHPSVCAKAYNLYHELLLEQIKLINPDIIIGGNTLGHFISDLGLSEVEEHQLGSVRYFLKNKKIYVRAYHPAQRGIVIREQYCDDIISAVKVWATKGK